MLRDLIIGTIASLIASGIAGFLGQKVTKKYNSIILKIYVLFLSGIVFITSELFAFVISNTTMREKISSHEIERLYRLFSHDIVFIIFLFIGVTVAVILVEAFHRSDLIEMKKTDEIQ